MNDAGTGESTVPPDGVLLGGTPRDPADDAPGSIEGTADRRRLRRHVSAPSDAVARS